MNENIKRIKMLDSIIYSKEPGIFLEKAKLFQEYLMMYDCAAKEIMTKLEILNEDLKFKYGRSPMEFIQSRIKSPESIIEKLQRKGNDVILDSLQQIEDIAGIRIVCSFIDDIYEIAEMLISQDDVTLLSCTDYICCPKSNGYRSYHMIIEIPVFFSDRKLPMKVEIQIRTIAMDFWASLEHKLKYKKDVKNSTELTEKLKHCADVIAKTDLEMQDIRKQIDADNAL